MSHHIESDEVKLINIENSSFISSQFKNILNHCICNNFERRRFLATNGKSHQFLVRSRRQDDVDEMYLSKSAISHVFCRRYGEAHEKHVAVLDIFRVVLEVVFVS